MMKASVFPKFCNLTSHKQGWSPETFLVPDCMTPLNCVTQPSVKLAWHNIESQQKC